MSQPPHNTRLELALDLLTHTGRNLFLTGKAGTGKTTFLNRLHHHSPKRMVVVAPTGVAAIRAGGVTIHSFFQLPFGPQIPNQYLPDHQKQPAPTVRMSRDKLNILRSMDLLVIDEVSMVRADLLDAIDGVLRRIRLASRPFGGVQVLLIGDLQQLSPVVKETDWNLLSPFYKGPFFFQSKVLENFPVETIELQHIYRQSDPHFIQILNEIRENRLTPQSIQTLHTRYQPQFGNREGYITLCTHVHRAQYLNEQKMQAIPLQPHRYQARVEGEFPEYSYPNEASLLLKPGAQVMFVRNDTSPEKRYYNGKIGRVEKLSSDTVWVQCHDEPSIAVSATEWPNFQYTLNPQTQEIEEKQIGSFTQIPLKPAWAITIHKSQGLTFEKVVIDAGDAFTHGQVYVALSRCKSLEGMILLSPIDTARLFANPEVSHYTRQAEKQTPTPEKISFYRKEYEQELVADLFRFNNLKRQLLHLQHEIDQNRSSIIGTLPRAVQESIGALTLHLWPVAEKFEAQLTQFFHQNTSPSQSPILQERIQKGCGYFLNLLQTNLLPWLTQADWETDNKAVKKSVAEGLQRTRQIVRTHSDCLAACLTGFSIESFLNARSLSRIERNESAPHSAAKAAPKTAHPKLYTKLYQWRDVQIKNHHLAPFQVLQAATLIQLTETMPQSMKALAEIKGLGKTKIARWGKEILEIIHAYAKENGLSQALPDFTPMPQKEVQEKHTWHDTLNLFRLGKTIPEIAQKASLTTSTIENHLGKAIEARELEVTRLVEPPRIARIRQFMTEHHTRSLQATRQALGEEYRYAEIKWVVASFPVED